MTLSQQAVTIGLCMLGTMLTRYLPFLIFSEKRQTPEFVQYLSRCLPSAVFGMLIIYCLKDVNFTGGTCGIPELIAIAATVILHLLRRQMLLSIAGGTACYLLLLHLAL